MRINCYCFDCITDGKEDVIFSYSSRINESGMYEFTCENGHKNMLALQNDKYDIAFHDAILELKHEVPKHAVIEFNTALDTFFEFAIKMICSLCSIEENTYEQAWKGIESQSERQLGAYLFIYLTTFKKVAPSLNDDQRHTRNNCVHKGRIPTYAEAEKFGAAVHKIIIDGIINIKKLEKGVTSNNNHVLSYVFHEVQRKSAMASDRTGELGVMAIPTELAYSNAEYKDFQVILDDPISKVWD